MSPEPGFERVERLFRAARKLPEDEREAFLARETDDAAIAAEVRELLGAATDEDDFLATPALGAGFRVAPIEGGAPPERIGPYRVLERVGSGGMGIVYRAEQEYPRRVVALKVLRTEHVSHEVLARFEREAEVLGRLRHPGIAQIHEAGVARDAPDEPRPYIAMEFVDGPPLTTYARPLDTRARIELIVQVARAVDHAHARGVVHRDLKPANVLVDTSLGAPQPKVLDFGIARVAGADGTLRTSAGELLGTLAYMSPEQAAGDPQAVDARSDVHALGGLLHELLAGRPPLALDGIPLARALQRLQSDEPPLLVDVAPDLATITAKALEKEPVRRYASAAALADDLERWLNDEPILAHPPSTLYQLRKYTRRNRGLLVAGVVVLITLLCGIVGTSTQWWRAASERDRAERRLQEVWKLSNAMLFELNDEIQHLPGSLEARRILVTTAIEHLTRIEPEAEDDPHLLFGLGIAWRRVAEVQGAPNQPNLGELEAARASLSEADRLLTGVEGSGLGGANLLIERTNVEILRGDLELARNAPTGALAHYEAAEAAALRLAQPHRMVGVARTRRRRALTMLGRTAELDALVRQSVSDARALAAAHPNDWMLARDAWAARIELAEHLLGEGDVEGALAEFLIAAREREETQDPASGVRLRDLVVVNERVGDVALRLERFELADEHLRRSIGAGRELLAASEDDASAEGALAVACNRLGELRLARGDGAARDRTNVGARRRHAVAVYKQGEVRLALAQDPAAARARRRTWTREACEALERCIVMFEEMQDDGLLAPSDAGTADALRGELEEARARHDALAGNGE